ncbi:hypothetical protein C2G38_2065994 [Gigaspora rosea]|uniref:RING-type domain-containing protein n=1 Tax=Gigaspora rosea TaxID=44941 RepID=A0A397VTW1_9GLOM|nr:hypothetical protein C2G38_2065994 [Gigaspora rosea]
MPITGPCTITTCKRESSTRWKRVTDFVINKGQANNTLPPYLQIGDTICLTCYNMIVVNSLTPFQHTQPDLQDQAIIDLTETSETNEAQSTTNLTFSESIKILTDLLYTRENKEERQSIYSFDEFRSTMESEDARLKSFFTELYLSSNPSSKNQDSRARAKKQLLFVCYFLCGIRNKFVNDVKTDIAMFLDSSGSSNACIDTFSDLGIATTSRTVQRLKSTISEEHEETVNSALVKCAENAMVLNIDDYYSIHTERAPDTTTTSTAAHLAMILMNPIMTQRAILKLNIHNPLLVDAELIKTNIESRFMRFYGLSHNRHWGFHIVNNNTRLEELTVHSYDVRLKEKSRSMKDTILIDLQKNDLHSMDAYIKAINTVVNVPSMQQYIQEGYIIPVVADWPGQIHLRTAISRFICHQNLSNITDQILSFLPIIGPLHILLNSRELVFLQYRPFFSAMYGYIFGEQKPLVQTPKPWRINLLLEISRSAWQLIATNVEAKFGPLCKDAEYLALKDLLDNMIPLVLDIYAVFFRSGDFDTYLESCFRAWTIFFKFSRKNYTKAPLMFLSDIFYWELNNHPILDVIKAELPKFSDSTVEIFHSFLRRSTQRHTEEQEIIKYGRCINRLRLDDSGFRENFAHTSTWAAYEYSAHDILALTNKCACFFLQCFSKIYVRLFHGKSPLILTLQAIVNPSSTKKQKVDNVTISLPAMHMLEAQLCHLPLGFNTSHTPNPFHYCDASNCSISPFVNTDPVVLSCSHGYHKSCYANNGFICVYCLSLLKDGVDKHVQSLLESLQFLERKKKKKKETQVEGVPCDDNNEFEKVKYKAFELEEAL